MRGVATAKGTHRAPLPPQRGKGAVSETKSCSCGGDPTPGGAIWASRIWKVMNPTGSPGKAACWRGRGQPLGAQSPERGGAEWVWGGGGNKWGALGPQMLMGSVLPEPTLPARHFEIQRAPANRILSSPGFSDTAVISGSFPLPPPAPPTQAPSPTETKGPADGGG